MKKVEIHQEYLEDMILNKNHTVQQISQLLNIDVRTVIKYCKKYNVDFNKRKCVKPGDKSGLLTVISSYGKDKHGHTKWKCKCECGNIKIIVGHGISSNNTKSCGCLRYNPNKRKCKYQVPGTAMKNEIIVSYKNGAKNRNLDFKLTDKELELLFSGDCYYCGAKPSRIRNRKNTNGAFIYNGIDRKNPEIGYLSNNCVSCCTQCNISKHCMNLNEFLSWISKVHKHITNFKGIQDDK